MIQASSFENPLTLVMAGVAFVLVLACWGAAVTAVMIRRKARAGKIQRRLGMIDPKSEPRVLHLMHEGKDVVVTVPKDARGASLLDRLECHRRNAGWGPPVQSLVLGVTGIAFASFVIPYALSGRILSGICGFIAAVVLCIAFHRRKVAKRLELFESQVIDALDLATRALRAGHPLVGAFRLIAEEIPAPVGTFFGGICQLQQLGMPLENAIQQHAAESNNEDMLLFATSVTIQIRSGGNLTDMMQRLVSVIRERIRLNRRARVLTAQTQFSKWILISLPFIFFVLLNLLNPKYMTPLLTTTFGKVMLGGAGALVLMGMYVMNRMSILKY